MGLVVDMTGLAAAQAAQLLVRLRPQRRSWPADGWVASRARTLPLNGTGTTVVRSCCILHTGAYRTRMSALRALHSLAQQT